MEGTEIANSATIIVSYEVDEEQTKGPELHRNSMW